MSFIEVFAKKKNLIFIGLSLLLFLSFYLFFYLVYGAKNEAVSRNDLKQGQNSEADQVLAENQKALSSSGAAFKAVRPIDSSDRVEGEADAELEIIAYFDFASEFCADAEASLKEALEEYAGKIRLAIRPFPIRQQANSIAAALAIECAAQQGKFFEAKSDFFSVVKAGGMSEEYIIALPARLELNQEKFSACYAEPASLAKIEASLKEAKESGVLGAPALFIGDESVPGAVPFEDFTDSAGQKREGLKAIIGRHLLVPLREGE